MSVQTDEANAGILQFQKLHILLSSRWLQDHLLISLMCLLICPQHCQAVMVEAALERLTDCLNLKPLEIHF